MITEFNKELITDLGFSTEMQLYALLVFCLFVSPSDSD